MADMRLIVSGAAGRMGRMLIRTITNRTGSSSAARSSTRIRPGSARTRASGRLSGERG